MYINDVTIADPIVYYAISVLTRYSHMSVAYHRGMVCQYMYDIYQNIYYIWLGSHVLLEYIVYPARYSGSALTFINIITL